MFIINDSVTCNLNENHFRFLTGYNDTHIYIPHLDNHTINEGINLYNHYCTFHTTIEGIMNGTNLPTKKVLKEMCKKLANLYQNEFLQFLDFCMPEQQHNAVAIINHILSLGDNYVYVPSNDCIMKYYMSSLFNDKKIIHACQNGHINAARWLLFTVTPDLHMQNEILFRQACSNGHIEMAKWMISLEPSHGKININGWNNIIFEDVCGEGHTDIAKWLLTLEPTHGRIDIHSGDGEEAFNDACMGGHVETVKWLLSLEETRGQIDIHTCYDFAFRRSCQNGHVEIVKLLLSLEPTHGPINIHDDYECAFRASCENGHIEIVKLLLSLEPTHGPINIHIMHDTSFENACKKGHTEIVKLLVELSKERKPIEKQIRIQGFLKTCLHNHFNVAQLLLQVYPDLLQLCGEDGYKYACMKGHTQMVQWLGTLLGI